MKLHADLPLASSIIAYGDGWLQLPQERLEHSLLLSGEGWHQPWACPRFDALQQAHLQALADAARQHQAQVVLLGSGARTRFPATAWLRPFITQQLGLEVMDTAAACRTFNILVGEGRRVLAGLILERGAESI
ncbi:Mth938-like domain-containing protein [Vandammella animalimorsus]|uniref:Mth938-like domain-containing protein n=1 Tax=Vandammella animalimorsus TaxID=2029117 RepID=UPI000BAA5162|nr:Mth938-like domain-containing protein [Vandammella animalimorsus]PAT33507.1 hypothetical protein CK626_01335 [Vandammella animalimorsus]